MKANDFEVPPMSEQEKIFLLHDKNPELIGLYEELRTRILLHGKIELRVTKDYINFKHPYKQWNAFLRQKEEKMGTLCNIYFRNNSIVVALNTLGDKPRDPYYILRPTTSFGVCKYYANIEPGDNLDKIEGEIRFAIWCVSKEHRVVRINNKYISI